MEGRKYHKRFAGFDLGKRSGRTSSLSDALEGWLSAHGMQVQHHMLTQLWKNWDIVMGPDIAALAHPLGHRGNILLVGGEDSLVGKDSLRRVDITQPPSLPPPPRPPRLGRLKLPPDSPVAACYEAYVRCFEDADDK